MSNQETNGLQGTIEGLTQDHFGGIIGKMLLQIAKDKPDVSLEDLFAFLSEKHALYRDALWKMRISKIRDVFTEATEILATASKGKKNKKSEAKKFASIPDFSSKEEVRKDFESQVLAVINDRGMADARGISFKDIHVAVARGSETQLRDTIKVLQTNNLIHATGETKGKRFVPIAFRDAAEKVHAEEKKKAEAAKGPKTEETPAAPTAG